jgi:hypothetical protein
MLLDFETLNYSLIFCYLYFVNHSITTALQINNFQHLMYTLGWIRTHDRLFQMLTTTGLTATCSFRVGGDSKIQYLVLQVHYAHLDMIPEEGDDSGKRAVVFLRGCPGWGANPGPLDFIYFLIFNHFTAEPQRLPNRAVVNYSG